MNKSYIISERGSAERRILLLGALGVGFLVRDFSVCLSVCLFVPGGSLAVAEWRVFNNGDGGFYLGSSGAGVEDKVG